MPGIVVRNAAFIVVICSAWALFINALRPDGLPVITKNEYKVFVPCPEPIKDVYPTDPAVLKSAKSLLLIDARPESLFFHSHIPHAVNLVFDYLYPVRDSALKSIAASRVRHVVVYGDGQKPDPGFELARELAALGIRNVSYVSGGYDSILKHIGAD